MDKEFREFCDLALARWGEDAQIRMCIEEMSELFLNVFIIYTSVPNSILIQ